MIADHLVEGMVMTAVESFQSLPEAAAFSSDLRGVFANEPVRAFGSRVSGSKL